MKNETRCLRRRITSFKGCVCVCVWGACASTPVLHYILMILQTLAHMHTHSHSQISIHTLKHMKERATVPSTDHTACTLSLLLSRCRDSFLHHAPLLSITGRHGSARLQRQLVCVIARLWMCGEGRETVRVHGSDKLRKKWASRWLFKGPLTPYIFQIYNYIIKYNEEDFFLS